MAGRRPAARQPVPDRAAVTVPAHPDNAPNPPEALFALRPAARADDDRSNEMSAILGFEFYQGPEVPPPLPIDFTMKPGTIGMRREKWAALLEDQIHYHDAWGILIVKPNTDVLLFDSIQDASAYEATGWGGTAYLLLAKEARA
jgi:hypothetical protein